MSPLINDKEEHLKFRYAVFIVGAFVLFIWSVKAFEVATETSLSSFGVLPRTLKGTLGIITGPLIHGDVFHLLSNTLPLILLGVMLFYFYHKIATEVFIWIYIVSGFWTWLLARDAYHIGASGIIYGMASFLFFSGIIRKSRQLMTLSAIVIFLYGGMIYGIIPNAVETNVSWESHLLGGIVGLMLAFLFRKTRISEEKNETPEGDQEENSSISHTGIENDIEINYSFKPTDKNKP